MMELRRAKFQQQLFDDKDRTRTSACSISPRESDEDLRELAENFQAYLSILREWDEKEKLRVRGNLTTEARNLN